MKTRNPLLLLCLAAGMSTCRGQTSRRSPRIGYLYPAGGRQGTTFEVLVGGQFLNRVNGVHISGAGIQAKVIRHFRPVRNLRKPQRDELQRRLRELKDKQLAKLPPKTRARLKLFPGEKPAPGMDAKRAGKGKRADRSPEGVELPPHPLLRNLEKKNLRELYQVADAFFNFGRILKKQPNAQLAEQVLIEVTIDPGTASEDRELRLSTPVGQTNPMCFQVGLLPEVLEQEPDDPRRRDLFPKQVPADLPVLLNGRIMPGDVDRFRFRAKQGRHLVIRARARHLVPFLADAVPGWFQATLTLHDAGGKEVAFADDYRFDPDPVLLYDIPRTGEYELEIRDAIYRGREDFVYRIALGELPFITQAFPLGGREGVDTRAEIKGWNLTRRRVALNTAPGDEHIRRMTLRQNSLVSNELIYAVDTLPENRESEPNDTRENAQHIELPCIVNGRIGGPGDRDVFRFEARAGDEIVAEAVARRLGSPLDSLLRLSDATGKVLAWNDDYSVKEGFLHKDMGILTHHADSYLKAALPVDGAYFVQLSDTRRLGAEAFAYRLRLSGPRPGFTLYLDPPNLTVPAGRAALLTVHVLRKDGFQGPIGLFLKDAPHGFVLDGGRIPAGRDRVRLTLTAPRKPPAEPVALQLVGRVETAGGAVIRRAVIPAEEVMQAFLYRHLAPAREFLVTVTKTRWGPTISLAEPGPVRVAAGSTAKVRINALRWPKQRKIELALRDPPKGVTVHGVETVANWLAFELAVEQDAMEGAAEDNLILEAFTRTIPGKRGRRGKKAAMQSRRVSLGVLPAIPFEIVRQSSPRPQPN